MRERVLQWLKSNRKKWISNQMWDFIKKFYSTIYEPYDKVLSIFYSLFLVHLQRTVPPKYKIGMAVLIHERPEYLVLCLDSLFQTKLYDYDITFLLADDGSADPRVRQIMECPRNACYKIIRYHTKKGHNSWGAAFNKAMKKLLEIDDFDIIGSCDSDALFHPEWLDQTMKICLWAKANDHKNILGPFSSFNSSDYVFHQILGSYPTPFGNYVVKRRMGAVNYFYFTGDLIKLGLFSEDKNDETIMTAKYNKLRVRNYCTETSYVEHIGHISILNQWRPTPVSSSVYGMNLTPKGWPNLLEKADTMGYYRFVKNNVSWGKKVSSENDIDVLIPVIEKDLQTLPLVVQSIRKNLCHPIIKFVIVAPESQKIISFCKENECSFVSENSVLPFQKKDINYKYGELDRSGWLFQQFIKLYSDQICSSSKVLVMDADTILVSPQVFIVEGKTVLLHSDEHHQPYFDSYQNLFGKYTSTDLSFVAHQMLFNSSHLEEMRNTIQHRKSCKWYEAIISLIDTNELSIFADYETYGQWMLQNYPNEIIREYWFNLPLYRKHLHDLNQLENLFGKKCRSISFHSWNK
jgi:hypothetical protein